MFLRQLETFLRGSETFLRQPENALQDCENILTAVTGFWVTEIIFCAAQNVFFIVEKTFGVSQKPFCIAPTIFYAPEKCFSITENIVGEAPAAVEHRSKKATFAIWVGECPLAFDPPC
jgi:hypothetical protein